MKTVLAVLAVAVLASGSAVAGWEWSIVPACDLSGAGMMVSVGFGSGREVIGAQHADPAGGAADDSIAGTIVSHLGDNWGKYLVGALALSAYERVAYNNDYWPHEGDDRDAPATGATAGTAAAGQGGSASSVAGDGNITIINNGGTVTYNAAPVEAE
jgi:hypothetical protein